MAAEETYRFERAIPTIQEPWYFQGCTVKRVWPVNARAYMGGMIMVVDWRFRVLVLVVLGVFCFVVPDAVGQPVEITRQEGSSHIFVYQTYLCPSFPALHTWFKDGGNLGDTPVSCGSEESFYLRDDLDPATDGGDYYCQLSVDSGFGYEVQSESEHWQLTVLPYTAVTPPPPDPALATPVIGAFYRIDFVDALPGWGPGGPPDVVGGAVLPEGAAILSGIPLGGNVALPGNVPPNSIITVGGGEWPVWTEHDAGYWSVVVPLKENAVNDLSVRLVAEDGSFSNAATMRVIEGDGFPQWGGVKLLEPDPTVNQFQALQISEVVPQPLELMPYQRAFKCEAQGALFLTWHDVTEYVTWSAKDAGEAVVDAISSNGIFTNITAANQPDNLRAEYDTSSGIQVYFDGPQVDLPEVAPGGKANGYVAGTIKDRYSGAPLGADLYGRVYMWNAQWAWLTNLATYYRGNYGGSVTACDVIFRMYASGYLTGHSQRNVVASPPTVLNWALRRTETGDPVVELIQPSKWESKAGVGQLALSAMVFDQFNELNDAALILNGLRSSIAAKLTPEGFYREIVTLALGDNTYSIEAGDAIGNEYETPEETVANTPGGQVPLRAWWLAPLLLAAGVAALRRHAART